MIIIRFYKLSIWSRDGVINAKDKTIQNETPRECPSKNETVSERRAQARGPVTPSTDDKKRASGRGTMMKGDARGK